MSTATTHLCQYGHEDCYRHMGANKVVLKLAPTPKNDTAAELLDLLEGLPVVFRSIRAERGLSVVEAAKQIGIYQQAIYMFEKGGGNGGTLNLLFLILEWIGPLTREEWDEYRFTDDPSRVFMNRETLLQELAKAMVDSRDPVVVARRVGYENRLSLARRLYRMDKPRLAVFFDRQTLRGADDPASVSVTSHLNKVLERQP